jgi:hypothetical protein
LDEAFRTGKITGDEYTETRMKLKQTLGSLQEELTNGHGNITEQPALI